MKIELDFNELLCLESGLALSLIRMSKYVLGDENAYNPYSSSETIIATDEEMNRLEKMGFFTSLDLIYKLQNERKKEYPIESMVVNPFLKIILDQFKEGEDQ